jgi:hypothetical protein
MYVCKKTQTYHSRFIAEGVAEASQIFLQDIHIYQNYLAIRNTVDVTGKPIAVLSKSISDVNSINPLVTFYDIHGSKRWYSFILSRTPHERSVFLRINNSYNKKPMHEEILILS